MAATNVLSHTVAGSISAQLKAKQDAVVRATARTSATPRAKRGQTATKDLFRMWKASPSHWKLMMSAKYNYIGVGIAYRSSNRKTFGSLIFTESTRPDRTRGPPWIGVAARRRRRPPGPGAAGTPSLQTHTAGLKSTSTSRSASIAAAGGRSRRTTGATSRAWNGLASGHTGTACASAPATGRATSDRGRRKCGLRVP